MSQGPQTFAGAWGPGSPIGGTVYEITIPKWVDYNPRGDSKKPSWLRLNNDIFTSQSLFDLTVIEKVIWIFVLTMASQKNSGSLSLNFQYIAHVLQITEDCVKTAIEKLEQLQCLKIDSRDTRTTSAQPTRKPRTKSPATNERTNVTNERDVTNGSAQDEPARANLRLTSLVWVAYEDAYFARYKTAPVRNATVNAQIKQIVSRLGEEAIEVVKFFVSHNDKFYVLKGHAIGLCLKDAESLRTQWARGRPITSNDVRQVEKVDHFKSQMERVTRGEA